MEHEGLTLEVLSAAQAARSSGGQVIAQVKRLAAAGTIDARQVHVPGILVDAVVVVPDQRQTMHLDYDPSLSGEVRVPRTSLPPMTLDARKLVARRAAFELFRMQSSTSGSVSPMAWPAWRRKKRSSTRWSSASSKAP